MELRGIHMPSVWSVPRTDVLLAVFHTDKAMTYLWRMCVSKRSRSRSKCDLSRSYANTLQASMSKSSNAVWQLNSFTFYRSRSHCLRGSCPF